MKEKQNSIKQNRQQTQAIFMESSWPPEPELYMMVSISLSTSAT